MIDNPITQTDIDQAADPYYEPYFCDSIQIWAAEMKFPEQWAAEIGVSEQDMFNWIGKFPEFARAYAVASTKLRAAFTDYLLKSAEQPNGVRTASLIAMIAKQRFRDLYCDPIPNGARPGLPAPPTAGMRDITPEGNGIDAEAVKAMQNEELQRELDMLRKRQEDIG